MDVDNAMRPALEEGRRKQPHVAGENDQFNIKGFQRSEDVGFVLASRETLSPNLVLDHHGGNVQPLGSLQPVSVGPIRNNDHRLVREAAPSLGFDKRLHPAAGTGNKHSASQRNIGRRRAATHWSEGHEPPKKRGASTLSSDADVACATCP